MTTFNEREKALENKFAHDEEVDFAVEARASKLFGLWIAEKLGLMDADAKTYAGQVVAANLDEAGFDDVIRKVKADLAAKGIEISDHMLEVELDKALNTARQQIMEDKK